MPSKLAFHFIRPNMQLSYGDPRSVVAGKTLEHRGGIELCCTGLHASLNMLDAAEYSFEGWLLTAVICHGEIIYGGDKLVCSRRTALAILNSNSTKKLLCKSAIRTAELALQWGYSDLGMSPDSRSLAAIETSVRFIEGEATAKELNEAPEAARAARAARAAAWAAWAARAAAWAAARAAAEAAEAARAAAWATIHDEVNALAFDAMGINPDDF